MTAVPWLDPAEWSQALQSLELSVAHLDDSRSGLELLAGRMLSTYAELEALMDELCDAVCGDCADICCGRATVWYDFPDLLFLTFSGVPYPCAQIHRNTRGLCSNLTATGCRLERSRRPFICTWYICAEQKRLLAGATQTDGNLFTLIQTLQSDRRQLERLFLAACS